MRKRAKACEGGRSHLQRVVEDDRARVAEVGLALLQRAHGAAASVVHWLHGLHGELGAGHGLHWDRCTVRGSVALLQLVGVGVQVKVR